MRVALFHNLPSGGAYRVMVEQTGYLSGLLSRVYTTEAVQRQQLPVPVSTYEVKKHKLLRSPFGRLNGLINIWNIKENERACKEVADVIDGEGYDVVLVHPCAISQTSPILQYLKTPRVCCCQEPFRAMHEMMLSDGFKWTADPLRGLYNSIAVDDECRSLTSATTVLTNSYYTREYLLRSYGVDSIINYPGINTDLFKPTGESRRNRVLSVGRLSFLKGHDFVIESVGSIDRKHRPSVDIVCGPDKQSQTHLEKLAEECEVDTQFHTNLSDEDLVSLYSSAVCTCVAAVLEPLGLTSLESMACGTPVVAIAEGGVRETVLDGQTGYLTLRDKAEFASKIEHLIENPRVVDELGVAGREWVTKHWTWARSIEQLTGVLENAARSK